MEKNIIITGKREGRLTLDYSPWINYAMVLNQYKTIGSLILINTSKEVWKNVCVEINGELIDSVQQGIPMLRPRVPVSLNETKLLPVVTKLMSLTESVQTTFCITVSVDGEQIVRQSLPLTVMPFNQWLDIGTMPEYVASFVTPNHPALSEIITRASNYLEQMCGSKSFDEYQSGKSLKVANQVEAIYNSLRDEKIAYVTVPASFETTGQRIRLVDQVLNSKQGNCMDLSVMLCSCLESVGLNSVLVFFNTHAMVGVWTEDGIATPMIADDVDCLMGYVEDDHQLMLIDAAALTRGVSLTEACATAERYVNKHMDEYNLYVDINSARNDNIRPLPHCILTPTGWVIEENNLQGRTTVSGPQLDINPGKVSSGKVKNKQLLWERKLLDLTLRNNLLNMRPSGTIVTLKPLPVEEILKSVRTNNLLELIDTKDNLAATKELYRAARNSIEENGANTLFLSIGTLRWYEDDSAVPHLAPIVFIPVEIVPKGPRSFTVRLRDEEPMVNITLFEMMRQHFDLDVPDVCKLIDQDNAFVQWKSILVALEENVDYINQNRDDDSKWEIIEECRLGIFSFAKFVMWNDVHNNMEVLESHPIIQSIIEGRSLLNDNGDGISARELDNTAKPSDYAIPLDVDSSQLEAIVASGNGRSFILHGPPGTGKSQTIANMIANALYQNKRVLFVAEKKAALEVVRERLKRIGLAPFCLEVHSNKVEKKSFLTQIDTAINTGSEAQHPFFEKYSEELFSKRTELNAYVDALHKKREYKLSLYDYINRYEQIEGNYLHLSVKAVAHLTPDNVEEIAEQFRAMDKVISIIGAHPSHNALNGLFPLHNTLENQEAITQLLSELPGAISKAEKKSRSIINRWFCKKTALEILLSSKTWAAFVSNAYVAENIYASLDTLKEAVSAWNNNIDSLRLWYHYSERFLKLRAANIPFAMDFFALGNSGADTADALAKGYYLCMARDIIRKDPTLRAFNGMLFEDVIKQFRCQSRNFQSLTIQELRHRLTSRKAAAEKDPMLNEELTILRKRISNNGRGISVRKILQQSKHVLPNLCPCMLMSPMSVSQYLDMQSDQFDLVIFDEASQIPTSEAIGAIARGKAIIVVGDPMQMPPTNFFMANNTTDADVDVDDLESILEDCISISLPNRYLSWHYRSKHESLIAFSNTNFYDGRLVTFPSVDDQDRKVSMQYVDGTYDYGKSRSNKAEARAIVNEVINRLTRQLPPEDGGQGMPRRSIGIVSFNKNQANLIEDMLMEALSKNRQLEELALGDEEHIFVKNLENVQGDERDLIFFSIGYGPDKDGRVSMNFGPLNQNGGERRLNVAVSRARYEMKVFSTLRPGQIDLQRTNAKGVKMLKRFLEYAETGMLPCPLSQLHLSDPAPIVENIASELEQKGYDVHQSVGVSQFCVDIAIASKDNPIQYEIGIMVDTDSYYNTPTASDREIVQPSVLNSLGWKLMHIWTVDWIEDPKRCMDMIQGEIDNCSPTS